MANRVSVSEDMLEEVVGGVLMWGNGKQVYAKDNPSVIYTYTSFTKCMQWLDANWNSAQNASCLAAMEAAGLVHRK